MKISRYCKHIVLAICFLWVTGTLALAGAISSQEKADRSAVLESDLLTNIQGRKTTSLDGLWDIIIDPYKNGYLTYRSRIKPNGYFKNQKNESPRDAVEYNFDLSDRLNVPGDWNTQMEQLYWYEGTVWYKKDFKWSLQSDKRVFLHFGAVNYDAMVWVNGEMAGRHEGGFTAFNFEVTDLLKEGDNFVILMVDNTRRSEGVPTTMTDWWNYGGITRPVHLVETEQNFIQDYFVQLAPGSLDRIQGWVHMNGTQPNQRVTLAIPEAEIEVSVNTDEEGYAEWSAIADLELWSPDNPKRYEVLLSTESDQIADTIGFRSIETRGEDILLNGKPIFLRGINIHEEAPYRSGRANNLKDAETLLGWAKEMGCNYVRWAHYPHNEIMTREADRLGILIWAEVPVYWAIQWENPETLKNARNQLSEMIHRDKNRAAVILWSLFNETEESEERNDFIRSLIDRTRELDPTRLLTGALEPNPYRERTLYRIEDPLGEFLDVLGINQYHGWFGGSLEGMDQIEWESDFKKPLIISEFGGAAKQGFQSDISQRWSEDFQADLYTNTLDMLENISFLRGTSPWILMDFRSPRRPLPRIYDGWSRAGLISNHGLKKQAFYIMQEWYRKIEEDELQFGKN
ncbi:MAG: glycoside hydrolase family 2 TIM barrel-domain containing protein [Balneolales bacterium]